MSDDVQVLDVLRRGVTGLDDTSGISVAGAAASGRRRRRRRAAGAVGVAATAVGAVLAGALALGLGDGFPLLTSAPPAGRTATLQPPEPTDLDDAAAQRQAVEEVLLDAGLEVPVGAFTTSYARDGEAPVGVGDAVVAGAAASSYSFFVSTAHVDAGIDVASTDCKQLAPIRPDARTCSAAPQPDGSVLFEVVYDAGVTEVLLVHATGWVQANGDDDVEVLRQVALDQRLRW